MVNDQEMMNETEIDNPNVQREPEESPNYTAQTEIEIEQPPVEIEAPPLQLE